MLGGVLDDLFRDITKRMTKMEKEFNEWWDAEWEDPRWRCGLNSRLRGRLIDGFQAFDTENSGGQETTVRTEQIPEALREDLWKKTGR